MNKSEKLKIVNRLIFAVVQATKAENSGRNLRTAQQKEISALKILLEELLGEKPTKEEIEKVLSEVWKENESGVYAAPINGSGRDNYAAFAAINSSLSKS